MPYPEPLRIVTLADWLSGALSVSSATGELLAVLFIFAIWFIPMVLLRTVNFAFSVTMFLLLTVVTSIGWLPHWIWILIGVYFALEISGRLKEGF